VHAVEPGHFATFFLATFPLGSGDSLVYSNAGHNPAVLVHRDTTDLLPNCGPPLAVLDGFDYGQETRPFGPGDVLVIYSDGISESPVGSDFYGEERLEKTVTLAARAGKSSREITEALLDDVRSVAGEFRGWDDITLLVVRKL
jgi:serine phosphatase RsbU (regulator of sigma subunit)